MSFLHGNGVEAPKICKIQKSQAVPHAVAFSMLSRYLHQQLTTLEPLTLQQTHYDDLYTICQSIAGPDDQITLRNLRLATPQQTEENASEGAPDEPHNQEELPSPVERSPEALPESDTKDPKKKPKKDKKGKKSKKEKKKRSKKRKREHAAEE